MLRRLALLALLILLVACTVPVGMITPAPTGVATENPAWTPTPECSLGNPNAHCHFYFEAINTNPAFDPPYFTWPPSRAYFGVPGSPEVKKPTVQEPGPAELNDWYFELTGIDGTVIIPDFIPNVFCKVGDCDANVTGVTGKLQAQTNVQVQGGENYIGKVLYRTLFSTFDNALTYAMTAPYWQEVCTFYHDNGKRYFSPVGGLRTDRRAWSDDLEEEVLVAFGAHSDTNLEIACGFNIVQPVFNGQVQITEFSIMPVDWGDDAMALFLP